MAVAEEAWRVLRLLGSSSVKLDAEDPLGPTKSAGHGECIVESCPICGEVDGVPLNRLMRQPQPKVTSFGGKMTGSNYSTMKPPREASPKRSGQLKKNLHKDLDIYQQQSLARECESCFALEI